MTKNFKKDRKGPKRDKDSGGGGAKTNNSKKDGGTKTKIVKFSPLDHRSTYAHTTFETVKAAIVLRVLKTYDKAGTEVAESLKKEAKVALVEPTLMVSTDPDAAVKKREDAQYEMRFKA